MTFELFETESEELFASPGNYEVQLWFEFSEEAYIVTKTIDQGHNTIQFNEFSPLPPMYITVTDIPHEFLHVYGGVVIHLFNGGLYSYSTSEVEGSSVTFEFWNLSPGTFDISFRTAINYMDVWRLSSKQITAGMSISFNDFKEPPGPMSIIITDIPGMYHDGWGLIELYYPEDDEWDVGYGYAEITSSSTFWIESYWPLSPRTYRIILWFGEDGYVIMSEYLDEGENIISFSKFEKMEFPTH